MTLAAPRGDDSGASSAPYAVPVGLGFAHGAPDRGQPAGPRGDLAALGDAARGVDRRLRRPAPARAVAPRGADRAAAATGRTPSRRRSRRSRSGSTACCATCSGSGCRPSMPQGVVTGRHRRRRRGAAERAAHRAPALLAALPQPVRARAVAPTTCPRSSTRSWCCSSGCTSPTSSGATCRCRTCCSGAAPAGSRRTSSTPRPASCATQLSAAMRRVRRHGRDRERLRRAARPAGQRRRRRGRATRTTSSRCSRSATTRCGTS